jgi:DNA-binding transcriptional MerR regulator
MHTYKIGEVAKLANVHIETIRFYERKKLIKPLQRLDSGYRIFSEDTVKRIKFIKNTQELGFTLSQIYELLNLQVSNKSTCGAVNQKVKNKIVEIQNKITLLTRMKTILVDVSFSCEKKETTENCPLLRIFSENE